ncbi:MAG TPA: ABC transporter substrate-binding protein [Candidatus Limnocylindria bacterium]
MDDRIGLSRRTFLKAVGGLGALALIEACAPGSTITPSGAIGSNAGFLIPGAGAPKRGGTLSMALAGAAAEPPNWDPVLGGLLPWAGGWMGPYEYLLAERGSTFGDTEKAPGLAESWETTKDGLTWTFHLRKGVRWQNLPPVNGRELVAEDVAWTYRHFAANSVLKSKYTIVDKIAVPDSYTIVFTLKNPYAPFLPVTLAHDFVILPHEIFDKYGNFKDVAVGTGAWMVDKWDRGSLMSFKPNPDYWQMGADGKPLPYMAAYKVFNYPDQAGINAAIRAGQVDYMGPGVVSLDVLSLRDVKKDRPDLVYWDGQLANFTGIEFNMKKAPWNDVKVRRAIALGIDKDEVIAAGQFGDPIRSGVVPVPLTDYAWSLDKIKQRYPFDKQAAQKQLQDLGVAGMTIELAQNSPGANESQVIASQLTDLGFKVKITTPPNVPTGMATIAAGKFDLSFYIHSTSFEIDDWLSRYWSTTGPLNTWGYSNPAFDKLCAQEQQELDPAKRKAIIDQAQELLHQDMVAVPIGSRPVHKVINPRLKNVRMPHYQNERFTSIWIDG